jgi:hypothetical protein
MKYSFAVIYITKVPSQIVGWHFCFKPETVSRVRRFQTTASLNYIYFFISHFTFLIPHFATRRGGAAGITS